MRKSSPRSGHAKLPIAILTFPGKTPVSHYMQFIHYVVGGLGYLRKMNFVTQPGVELYKAIAAEIFQAGNQGELFAELKPPDPKTFRRATETSRFQASN